MTYLCIYLRSVHEGHLPTHRSGRHLPHKDPAIRMDIQRRLDPNLPLHLRMLHVRPLDPVS